MCGRGRLARELRGRSPKFRDATNSDRVILRRQLYRRRRTQAPREASRTLRGNNSRVRRASKSEAQPRTDTQNQIDFVAAYIILSTSGYPPAPVTTRLYGHSSLFPQGPQIRALPGSLAFAAINLISSVIPTRSEAQRAKLRTLGLAALARRCDVHHRPTRTKARKSTRETQGPSTRHVSASRNHSPRGILARFAMRQFVPRPECSRR
jgi:hypothetical protein